MHRNRQRRRDIGTLSTWRSCIHCHCSVVILKCCEREKTECVKLDILLPESEEKIIKYMRVRVLIRPNKKVIKYYMPTVKSARLVDDVELHGLTGPHSAPSYTRCRPGGKPDRIYSSFPWCASAGIPCPGRQRPGFKARGVCKGGRGRRGRFALAIEIRKEVVRRRARRGRDESEKEAVEGKSHRTAAKVSVLAGRCARRPFPPHLVIPVLLFCP